MPVTVRWKHDAGHMHLQAVLAITKVTIRPEAGVFSVHYGVWENMSAFKVHSEPLFHDNKDLTIQDHPSMYIPLLELRDSIEQSIPNIIPEEEINEQDS